MSDEKNNSDDIVLLVAGEERSGGLGQSIRDEAARLGNPALSERLSGELLISELSEIANEEEYLTRQLELLGTRTQLDLNQCELPDSSSGGLPKKLIGKLRGFIWRLIRFAPEWMVYKQNTVNEQLAISMAHEVRLRRRENEELRRRIESLESATAPQHGGDS